jgi:hypothetical protein
VALATGAVVQRAESVEKERMAMINIQIHRFILLFHFQVSARWWRAERNHSLFNCTKMLKKIERMPYEKVVIY